MKNVHIPPDITDVTEEWLSRTLQPVFPGIEVTSLVKQRIGEGVGISSLPWRLRFEPAGYPGAPHSLVLKLPAAGQDMRRIAREYHLYSREVRFYQDFAHRIPLRVPFHYASAIDEDHRFFLLLEDLADWSAPDPLTGATVAQIRSALRGLATLSATPLSPGLEGDWIPDWNTPYMRESAGAFVALLPQYFDRWLPVLPEGAERMLTTVAERIDSLFDAMTGGWQVLTHYDYRIGNILFGGREGTDVCVLDWQLVVRARHGMDLAWLLGTSMDARLRRANEAALLESCLQQIHERGQENYTAADLQRDYILGGLGELLQLIVGDAGKDPEDPASRQLSQMLNTRMIDLLLDHDWQAVLP